MLLLAFVVVYFLGWVAGYATCHATFMAKLKQVPVENDKVRPEDLRPRD